MSTESIQRINHTPDFAIRDWSAEFRDRALEIAFQQHRHAHNLKRLRDSLWYAAVAFFAVLFVDWRVLGFSPDLLLTGGARVVYSLYAFVALYRLRKARTARQLQWISLSTNGLAMLVSIFMAWRLPTLAPVLTLSAFVVVVATYLMLPIRLPVAVAQSLVLGALYVLACALGGSSPDGWAVAAMLLALNAMCLMGGYEMQRRARQEFRLLLENQRLSFRDHLTDCYNRRYLYERLLGREIEKTRQARGHLSVVICDIDHFKQVNDLHGHQAGDYVLTLFARLLIDNVGERGCVIRHGGEEFLLLLPNTDHEAARALSEALRMRTGELSARDAQEHPVRITASFGMASNDFAANPEIDASALITLADQQLYRAKSEGRNRVCSTRSGLRPPAPETVLHSDDALAI